MGKDFKLEVMGFRNEFLSAIYHSHSEVSPGTTEPAFVSFPLGMPGQMLKGKVRHCWDTLFKAVHVHKEGTCTRRQLSCWPLFIQSLEEGQARQAQDSGLCHCGPC